MLHPLAETHSCIIMYETQKKHTQNGCNESGSNNKITFMMGYAVVCCCHSKKKKKILSTDVLSGGSFKAE